MEGTTEPILVVIGDPIAGNPAQFALERSLRALELDWRVLSFDVTPGNVSAAIEGFAVTGIVGVMIARELAASAGSWNASTNKTETQSVDCLWRNDEGLFSAADQLIDWLETQIQKFHDGKLLWVGNQEPTVPLDPTPFERVSLDHSGLADDITKASVIILSGDDSKEPDFDREDWPENSGQTLVIDLGGAYNLVTHLRQRGYLVIGEDEFRVGALQHCILKWTGKTPSDDVVIDAIEEYLSV